MGFANETLRQTEPLVLEFEFAQVRQQILVGEESNFHVITNTEEGRLRASGHIGRVMDGEVDLVFEVYRNERGGKAHDGRIRLGEFASHGGAAVLPGLHVPYLWLRRGVDPVPSLIQALRRRDIDTVVAAQHLGRLREAAHPAVRDLSGVVSLGDADLSKLKGFQRVWVRETAAVALGRIGPKAKDAVPVLLAQLEADRPGDLRVAAAVALWKITRHPDAIPALTKSIHDADRDVRVKALDAVRELGIEAPAAGPILTTMFHDKDVQLRSRAAAALWAVTRDTRAIDALVDILDSDAPGRDYALGFVEHIGFPAAHRATEATASLAFSRQATVRRRVGDALVQIDPDASQSLLLLLQGLRERERRDVSEVAEVLAAYGPVVVPRLRKLVDQDDQLARDLAFYTLWKIGPPAVNTLAEALRHPNAKVRRRAAEYLGTPPLVQAVPVVPDLARALDDNDEQVRINAAHALMDMGPPAVPAMEQLLANGTPRTRKWAEEVLAIIKIEPAEEEPTKD